MSENFKIQKCNSLFHNAKLTETPDFGELRKLTTCTLLDDNTKTRLINYIKLSKQDRCVITYKNGKSGYGRVNGNNSIGSIWSRVRNTGTILKYIDIDMVNSQPNIMAQLCKRGNILTPQLDKYNNNREEILTDVINQYKCDRKVAKNLFIIMMYQGSFITWKNKNNIDKYATKSPFIVALQKELTSLVAHFTSANPKILAYCKKENKQFPEASVVSLVLQDYERQILEVIYTELNSPTNAILTYDGLNILKQEVDLVSIEEAIKKKTNYDIKLLIKEIDNVISAEELEANRDCTGCILSFEEMANKFELTHCKIKNKCVFVKEFNEQVLLFTKKQLIEAEEHQSCMMPNDKVEIFINKWMIKNDNIRLYDDMDVYPHPLVCPPNIYNLFKPFEFSKEKYNNYIPNQEGFEFVLNHINILCNRQIEVFKYFIDWIGQMIQFPAVKTTCITFISQQGGGKGCLIRTIERMIGVINCLETTKPSRDIWGHFNSLMQDAFFIHISELSKSETREAEGVIKGLTTDINLTINEKGIKQSKIKSYHRFIIASNKDDPINTSPDDRRNLIIRSSDELIKLNLGEEENAKYFTKLNNYIDDDSVIKTLYEYFNNLPDLDKFQNRLIPETEHQNILKAQDRSPIDIFFEELTAKAIFDNNPEVRYPNSTELFKAFDKWLETRKYKYDMSCQKFALHLNLHYAGCINSLPKTRDGIPRSLDITKLAIRYKLDFPPEVSDLLN